MNEPKIEFGIMNESVDTESLIKWLDYKAERADTYIERVAFLSTISKIKKEK